jgi:hypothetical protein
MISSCETTSPGRRSSSRFGLCVVMPPRMPPGPRGVHTGGTGGDGARERTAGTWPPVPETAWHSAKLSGSRGIHRGSAAAPATPRGRLIGVDSIESLVGGELELCELGELGVAERARLLAGLYEPRSAHQISPRLTERPARRAPPCRARRAGPGRRRRRRDGRAARRGSRPCRRATATVGARRSSGSGRGRCRR